MENKWRTTVISNYKKKYPGSNDQEAWASFLKEMREKGAKGGRNGTGHKFAHGKADPKLAGEKGRKSRDENKSRKV